MENEAKAKETSQASHGCVLSRKKALTFGPGHLQDLPWSSFVHQSPRCPSWPAPPLGYSTPAPTFLTSPRLILHPTCLTSLTGHLRGLSNSRFPKPDPFSYLLVTLLLPRVPSAPDGHNHLLRHQSQKSGHCPQLLPSCEPPNPAASQKRIPNPPSLTTGDLEPQMSEGASLQNLPQSSQSTVVQRLQMASPPVELQTPFPHRTS